MFTKRYCYTLIIFIVILALTKGFREIDVNGVRTVFALENETAVIKCHANFSMSHCSFMDPKGMFHLPDFFETECRLAIEVNKNNIGIWKCEMVRKYRPKLMIKAVLVKIAKPLTAIEPTLNTVRGRLTTLTCIALQPNVFLTFCKFISPYGRIIYINDNVTEENPYDRRYYSPKGQSLDKGYCSMTIREVKTADLGLWQCEAGWPSGKQYSDDIYIGSTLEWLLKVVVGLFVMHNLLLQLHNM